MRQFNSLPSKTIALTLAATLGGTAACGRAEPGGTAAPGNQLATPTVAANTWPGINPNDIPYPGRVALPQSTCTQWSVNSPQPSIQRPDGLFTVVDARRSIPVNCDYLTDSGSGSYTGASYESPVQLRADGTRHTPDGTVVRITAFSLGQFACNNGGGSNIWIQYQERADGPHSWTPVINTGGAPNLQTLEGANIPELGSPYQGTSAQGC